MKKTLLITLASMGLTAGAFAQGSVAFTANAANGLVTYSTDNATTAPVPTGGIGGAFGSGHISFFTAPNGTVLTLGLNGLPNFTGWTEAQTLNILTGSGKSQPTTVVGQTTDGAPGANIEFEVVGWNGTATTWAQAVGNIGATSLVAWSGRVFPGSGQTVGQLSWSQPTGNPTTTPPGTAGTLVTGAAGYAGLVLAPVPEPSTIALGGLGAAALLMFRRRK